MATKRTKRTQKPRQPRQSHQPRRRQRFPRLCKLTRGSGGDIPAGWRVVRASAPLPAPAIAAASEPAESTRATPATSADVSNSEIIGAVLGIALAFLKPGSAIAPGKTEDE